MSRFELMRRYAVKDGVIQDDGPFNGQMLYVPYFWEAYLAGNAQEVSEDHIVLFGLHSEDFREFPELHNRSVVRLRQLSDGKIVEA